MYINLYHIVSVDECQLSSGGCYQICKTTTDGFGCGCFNGYTLASDQRSCKLCIANSSMHANSKCQLWCFFAFGKMPATLS